MQYQVPQFIEVESKIVGPLTLKQFMFIGAAFLMSFFLFFALQTWLWFILTAILGIAAAALAFLKVNGRPLTVILISALSYFWQPKLYLWERQEPKQPAPELPQEGPRIKNLWSKLLTTTTSITKREKAPAALIKKMQGK